MFSGFWIWNKSLKKDYSRIICNCKRCVYFKTEFSNFKPAKNSRSWSTSESLTKHCSKIKLRKRQKLFWYRILKNKKRNDLLVSNRESKKYGENICRCQVMVLAVSLCFRGKAKWRNYGNDDFLISLYTL